MAVTSLPASTSLLDEINALAPRRDTGADGTIGDPAHQAESSDHNPDDTPGVATPYSDADGTPEVHARDVDSSGPWPPGWSMERVVQTIVARHRLGLDSRLQNVIYNRRIWSRSWGWTQHAYIGADPHTGHAHFSFRYGSGAGTSNPENITSPWGIYQEDDMPTADEIAKAMWDEPIALPDGRTLPARTVLAWSDQREIQTRKDIAAALAADDDTDEAAIIAGVLAGLRAQTPEQTAAALRVALGDQAAEVGRLLTAA